jgi:hypothetical protein
MSGPWYEPEAREIADVCERCGEAGDTVLGDDGELCAACREELDTEIEAVAALLTASVEER